MSGFPDAGYFDACWLYTAGAAKQIPWCGPVLTAQIQGLGWTDRLGSEASPFMHKPIELPLAGRMLAGGGRRWLVYCEDLDWDDLLKRVALWTGFLNLLLWTRAEVRA